MTVVQEDDVKNLLKEEKWKGCTRTSFLKRQFKQLKQSKIEKIKQMKNPENQV